MNTCKKTISVIMSIIILCTFNNINVFKAEIHGDIKKELSIDSTAMINDMYLKDDKIVVSCRLDDTFEPLIKYGLYNLAGKKLLDIKYKHIKVLENGYIVVTSMANHKYLYSPKMEFLTNVKEAYAINNYIVYTTKKKHTIFVYNENWESVATIKGKTIQGYEDNFFIVKNNGGDISSYTLYMLTDNFCKKIDDVSAFDSSYNTNAKIINLGDYYFCIFDSDEYIKKISDGYIYISDTDNNAYLISDTGSISKYTDQKEIYPGLFYDNLQDSIVNSQGKIIVPRDAYIINITKNGKYLCYYDKLSNQDYIVSSAGNIISSGDLVSFNSCYIKIKKEMLNFYAYDGSLISSSTYSSYCDPEYIEEFVVDDIKEYNDRYISFDSNKKKKLSVYTLDTKTKKLHSFSVKRVKKGKHYYYLNAEFNDELNAYKITSNYENYKKDIFKSQNLGYFDFDGNNAFSTFTKKMVNFYLGDGYYSYKDKSHIYIGLLPFYEQKIVITPVNNILLPIKKSKKPIVKSIKVKSTKSLSISVSKDKSAKGYQVAIYTSRKRAQKDRAYMRRRSTSPSFLLTSKRLSRLLKKKKTFYIKVRAYKSDYDGSIIYGQWSKRQTAPISPSN